MILGVSESRSLGGPVTCAVTRSRQASNACPLRSGSVKTSIPFHLRILEDPQVLAGQIHTRFLEEWLAKGFVGAKEGLAEIALVAGSLYLHTRKPSVPVSAGPGGSVESLWKLAGRHEAVRRR